jgi:hypothetical protein
MAAQFNDAVAALFKAAEHQRGLQVDQKLQKAMQACGRLTDEEAVMVARALEDVASPTGAGCLAVWLGAGVEAGRAPEVTCRPILETFLKWSRIVEAPPVTDDPEDYEDEHYPEPDEETMNGLQLLGRALVAHLSRSSGELRWIADSPEISTEIERVEAVSIGAGWLMHLLRQQSGELIVLGVGHRRGALVRYRNIANCFHLFTLLQGALAARMPGAGKPSETVLGIARGEYQGDGYDHAWWHYGQPTSPNADINSSIWGEGTPEQIARIDGTQVLLLWPPIVESRTWDTGFFMPVLHASLPGVEVIAELSAAETERWWARLGLPDHA